MNTGTIRRSVAAGTGLTLALGLAACAGDAATEPAASPTSPAAAVNSTLYDLYPEDIRAEGAVTVVGDVAGPWRVKEEDGSISGLTPEILDALSELTGLDFVLEIGEGLPAIKLGVQSGRYDIGFGPVLSNESSQKDLLFIDYVLGRAGLLYPADGDAIEGIADLCGKRLAVIEGSAAFDALIERVDGDCAADGDAALEVTTLADTSATILAVESGRADLAATSAHRAAYAVSENPDRLAVYITNDDEFTPDHLGMIFNVEDKELAEAVFATWEQLVDDGTFLELMTEYGLGETALTEPELHVDPAS